MASQGVIRVLCLLAFSCNASAEKTKLSPVAKVIQLLDELKGKITQELSEEAASMEEFEGFCNEDLREKGYAIKTAARNIVDLKATIEDASATILEANDDIEALGGTIAAKDQELAAAQKNRKAQRADFEAAEQDLLASVDETTRAVAQLSGSGSGSSFLQRGVRESAAPAVEAAWRSALQSVVRGAAVVEGAGPATLRSLVQEAAGEETQESNDLSLKALLAQPQAKVTNYESQSGGVLKAVKELQSKAEAELEDLRKKEMQDDHAFQLLAAGLEDELKNMKEKLAAAQALHQSSTQQLSGAQADLSATQDAKADDETYVRTRTQDCSDQAEAWETRHRSATAEMGAIAKAREILVKGVTALVQTGTVRVRKAEGSDQRLRVATILRNLGHRYHSFVMIELSSAAATDPFSKIRGLIEEMIEKLLKEADEEASHKAFCDKEMGATTSSKNKKEAASAKQTARIDAATAEAAKLSQEVKTLEAEIADIDRAQSEATKIRNEEKSHNSAAMAEFQGSADAVNAAIGALKSYYEGASLIQMRQKALSRKMAQPEFGSANSDAGGGIISILEVAESDFSELHAETETAETTAAASYDKLTQENKVSKAVKESEAESKRKQIASLEVTLAHQEEDRASVSQELDALNAYLEKLKPECEVKVMSYEEKKAAREAEIEGLKDALDILQGDAAFL